MMITVLLRRLTKLSAEEKGSILILTAASTIVLMGVVGLGLDSGSLFYHRRVMQTAADAGAMHGASELFRSQPALVSSSARKGTAQNGFTDGASNVVVTVDHPPTSGFYANDDRFVEVLITQPSPTFFMRLFGFSTVQIPARAVAGAGANGKNCIYVLEDADADAFSYNSTARLNADCGLVVNSRSGAALHETSNANVAVTDASITGNLVLESASVLDLPSGSEARIGVPPSIDPLAYLTRPAVGSCNWVNRTIDSLSPVSIFPGVYCGGLRLKNNTVVNVQPGLYLIAGGGITTEGGSVLQGAGVTFYLSQAPGYPSSPLSFQSSSRLDLRAPTTGDYAGILFYQDPLAGNPNDINKLESSSAHVLEGALYFPTQVMRIESSSTVSAAYTLLVARVFIGDSNSVFNFNADYSGLPGGSPIKRLSLVE